MDLCLNLHTSHCMTYIRYTWTDLTVSKEMYGASRLSTNDPNPSLKFSVIVSITEAKMLYICKYNKTTVYA